MKTYNFNKIQNLKFGENIHQQAELYGLNAKLDWVLACGSEILYENFLNATIALEIAAEFYDVNAIIVANHQSPSAVALANNLDGALNKVLDSNPQCVFGATICSTKAIDLKLTKKLIELKPELIIAPAFEQGVVEEFKIVKNIKVIQINTPYQEIINIAQEEIKITPFGVLIQQKDTKDLDVKTFKVITKKKPTQQELEDMIFAYKIAKHAKSATAVVAKDLRTLGITSCESDYETAVETALNRVCDSTKDSIVALDCVLNSKTVIQILAQNRVSALIQSAGSLKDNEIIECADKYEIAMVSTAITHYRH